MAVLLRFEWSRIAFDVRDDQEKSYREMRSIYAVPFYASKDPG